MHQQSTRQLQERITSLAPSAVLDRAVEFFSRQSGVYAAFPEKRGPTHVMLRGMGGEEIAIAAWTTDAGTRVSGSTYLFDQQVARFLNALPTAAALSAVALPAVAVPAVAVPAVAVPAVAVPAVAVPAVAVPAIAVPAVVVPAVPTLPALPAVLP